MPYEIRGLDPHQAFLDGLGMSPRARAKLGQFVEVGLGASADEIRANPRHRCGPKGEFFTSHFVLVDFWTGDVDRWYNIRFILDDSGASKGILEVVFVDCEQGVWT